MARVPPTKEDRDANLETLRTAVNEYVEQESIRLDNESKFMRAVLDGRAVQKTATVNLREGARLVSSEIEEYLTFGV